MMATTIRQPKVKPSPESLAACRGGGNTCPQFMQTFSGLLPPKKPASKP
ncbi:MAG: hypothetical protein GX561_07055 [Lentisphaerae bacterium]|nr:hypothetical protein [Lentisphaerota bacterium]